MQASLGALAAASLLAGTAASTGLDQSRAVGPAGPLPTPVESFAVSGGEYLCMALPGPWRLGWS